MWRTVDELYIEIAEKPAEGGLLCYGAITTAFLQRHCYYISVTKLTGHGDEWQGKGTVSTQGRCNTYSKTSL